MAKVMVSPAVYNLTDLRPSSRALTIRPRPNSSSLSRRPYSANSSRATEVELEISPRSQIPQQQLLMVSPNGRKTSVSSISSFGGSQSPMVNQQSSLIEVESMLREKIRANFAEMKQAFQSLDAEKSLSVTKSEFCRVLDTFCFHLTKEQLEEIIKKIGRNRDGTICYSEFMDRFHYRGGTPDGFKWLNKLHKYQQNKVLSEDYEEIEKKLRTKISGQLQSVLKAMRLFDYNRDGKIQRHELRRILENFCFKLSDAQFDKLWCKYDLVRNGNTLDYMDFLKRLGVDTKRKGFAGNALKAVAASSNEKQQVKLAAINSRRPNTQSSISSCTEPPTTLRDLEHKLRRKMVDNFGNISRAFIAFDRKGDGFVTLDELKRVLFHFAFPMSDYLFEQLMDRCGIRANHKIAYEQFLSKFQEPRAPGNGQTLPIKTYHRVNPIREAEDPPSTEDIWNQLHKKILDSFTTVKEAFLVFDDNKDGRVTKRDFRRVLETFCFRMTQSQFNELMARIDPHNKGYISYLEFLDAFEPRETMDGHPWLNGDNSTKSISPPAIVAWSTVEEILRSKITENWKSIAEAYMKVNDNRDGSISKDELRKLLEKFCLPLSDDHFEMLWSRCDTNADNTIDFEEFLNQLGVDIVGGDFQGTSTRIHNESEARANFMKEDQTFRQELAEERALGLTGQMNAEEVMEILKDYIAQRSSNFRKTFVKFDADGDGKISRKEFRLVIESFGLYMADEQFRLLSARLGFHKGKLSYMDFLDQFQDRRTFGVGERVVYQGQSHNKPVPLDEAMDAHEVEIKLRNKLRESFQDLREAFRKIDFDRNGVVTRAEFRRILDSLMFSLTDEEFDKLMTKFGVKRGCRLNYVDFLKRFEQTEKIEKGHPWLYSNNSLRETLDMAYMTADDADQIIKQKAQEQMNSVAKAFLTFDQNGNGVVTKKEMRKVLYRFQIPMEKEEFNKLWKRYDTDGNGHVDHKEFLVKLGVELTPGDFHGPSTKIAEQSYDAMARFHQSQKELHEASTVNQVHTTAFLTALEVEQKLKDKFRDGYESFRKAFEAADKNKDGYVSKVELQKVLFDFYLYLDDVQLGILLDRCGLSGKSRLSYKKFLSAFQDSRESGYGRVTLDTPFHAPSPVVFESHENLSPDRAITKLRAAISANCDNIKKAFSAFDPNGAGVITIQDLHQIINAFCFWLSPKQFKALLKQVNVLEGDMIAYDEFLYSFQKSDTEASRKWLENLHPSSQNNQQNIRKHRRAMSDTEVDSKIREVVVARFYSFAKAFTDNDVYHLGRVSRETLRRILDEHAFRMNDEQFDHVFSKFSNDPDGSIDYKDFLKEYSSRPGVHRASSATPMQTREKQSPPETPLSMRSAVYSSCKRFSSERVRPVSSASDIERKVKNQVCRSWQQLQKSFRNADSKNLGTVSYDQLKDILLQHNIAVKPSEILVLCKKHDTYGNGKVVYKDFLRHFVLTMPKNTGLTRPRLQQTKVLTSPGVKSDQLCDLMATTRSQVRENWKEMRRAFRALDKEGNGTCDLVEFRQQLKRFRIDLNDEESFHLFSFYDKNLDGRISYNDFLRAHLE